MERSELFRTQRPHLDDIEMTDALKAGRIITSFDTHPAFDEKSNVSAVGIKWKFGNGKTETVIFDRYSATVLQQLFSELEKNNWTAQVLVRPGEKQN
jgi:hypothetical protein